MNDSVNERRILRMPEVCHITGLGKSTIYKKLADGLFPDPVRLGPRAMGWRANDIDKWLAAPERKWDPADVK